MGNGAKKQHKKKGKVLRVNERLQKKLEGMKADGETWSQVVEKILGDGAMWTIPSCLFPSRAAARGYAIAEAARADIPFEEIEPPMQVREGL